MIADASLPPSDRPYAKLVGRQGLSDGHRMMIDAVRPGSRVLDVGCASGYLAEALAARGCTVVGIEPDATNAETARAFLSELVVGDIERADDRARLPGAFDYVLYGDVLEHLRDPWSVLRATHELHGRDGRVVVSIPNVAHWSARREIARGRFPYADSGLFDRTHLRFFTRASAHELVASAGYEIEHEAFTRWRLPLQKWLGPLLPKSLQPKAARWWPELFAFQFVMTLRPRVP